MEERRELKLHLPEDLLVPKGDAFLIKLKEHLKQGGQVKVFIEDQGEKTVDSEEELFEITAPYVNQ